MLSVTKKDETYMRMALELATRAEGKTSPNPLVGALIVKNGRVIGKGYHKMCGKPHAEIEAIRNARGRDLRGAALYVTLEPCNHFGRTPPCTDALIKSGIKKVFIGMKDPNPVNNGRGVARLNAHGIKTVVGVLQKDSRAMNAPFIKFITKKMPYVTVKIAESLDGKIATKTGDSKWITSDDARRYVHHLRGVVDAVMVGANTAIKDDPLLLDRSYGSKQPVRIVVSGRKNIPSRSKLFRSREKSPVIIAKAKKGRVDLSRLLKELASIGIQHILVEGGGELVASLVENKLVDRFLFFIAPKIVGGRNAVTSVEGSGVSKVKDAVQLRNIKIRRFDKDILIEAEAA
jgi:diaminohydroxyphosphoribosylaminopyrimidine deaminase/5-amino-6-(5-phosphoribosylamino)uracil reductase